MGQGGGPPPSAQYWNPLDKHANITLSDSNKVATNAVIGDWRMVRSVTSHNSGKWYAEGVYLSGETWSVIVGIANAVANLASNVGADANSYGLQATGSVVGGPGTVSPGYSTPGEYARIAVDVSNGRIWLGNSSSWAGGGNPAAGTSPTTTFTASSTQFLAASLYDGGADASLRIRTALADFEGTPPSGFSAWG